MPVNLSIEQLLTKSPATSADLQRALGASQTHVAKLLRGLGSKIVSVREGRSIRYMLTKNAFGGNDRLPISVVDANGNTVIVGFIRPLAHGGYFLEKVTGIPDVLLGDGQTGLFDDLPYFLDELRPQGFIGKKIAVEIASKSPEFPEDPRAWTANHVGKFLNANGHDLPGNLQFGENAMLRIRQDVKSHTNADYPMLAEQAISGTLPGSSAGGEQPKFAVFSREKSSHVIVKFSPPGDEPVARRWKDILITEHIAAETLHLEKLPAAETRLFELEDRIFLESKRFDRAGEYGRLSMMSLQSIDSEFVGAGNDWVSVLEALYARELITFHHLFETEYLWVFGKLIHNADMHLGNLSLGVDGNIFRLLPAYDMCSMGFAPNGGNVRPYGRFNDQVALRHLSKDNFKKLRELAKNFWEKIEQEPLVSNEFREFARSLIKKEPIQASLF